MPRMCFSPVLDLLLRFLSGNGCGLLPDISSVVSAAGLLFTCCGSGSRDPAPVGICRIDGFCRHVFYASVVPVGRAFVPNHKEGEKTVKNKKDCNAAHDDPSMRSPGA